MPNWCNNKVKVFGESEQLAQVAKIFKDEKSIFNNIIQSPDWKAPLFLLGRTLGGGL